MVSKLIVWDADREQATARMVRALREYKIEGLITLLPFHETIMQTSNWAEASTCSELLEDPEWLASTAPAAPVELTEQDDSDIVEHPYTVEVGGRRVEVKLFAPPIAAGGGGAVAAAAPKKKRDKRKSAGASGDDVNSPLQGNMWKVVVEAGQTVEEGQLLCIIEAMKMENEVKAHKAGTIASLSAKEGEAINSGDHIATIVSPAAAE